MNSKRSTLQKLAPLDFKSSLELSRARLEPSAPEA
jgi:hypothetical protein